MVTADLTADSILFESLVPGIPRLSAGDHLDRQTFHERYEAMPRAFRAELIEGVVIVPSPVSPTHAMLHAVVMGWGTAYWAATPGVAAFDNGSIFLLEDSEPQPDLSLIIRPEFGGQTYSEKRYIGGPPELILEVSVSSAAYDLYEKFRDYEEAGVREYVVLVAAEREVRWFHRKDGKFVPLAIDSDGIFRSCIFPGLWLNAAAAVKADASAVMQALQQGLATPEHAAFVESLKHRGQAES